MSSTGFNARAEEPLDCSSMHELISACVEFYNSTLKNDSEKSETSTRRRQLAVWVRKFHRDCGTLTPSIEEAINRLCGEPCLIVMTAHQPNLFAYSGVMRKATFDYVLGQELSQRLNLPVVNFFGLADQDFTDDRWVKSTLVPDVERRNGVLELRLSLPEKMMLNKVTKPSKTILNNWRNEIERWIERKHDAVYRLGRAFGIKAGEHPVHMRNFESFWEVVEKAAERAEVLSDFNAFVMSQIINRIWEYDTLFCRFSECQRIFEQEFSTLVIRFEEYSRYVHEAMLHSPDLDKGVYEQENITLPFWLHCDCGSKVRLMATTEGGVLSGSGRCLRCQKEYHLGPSELEEPKIKEIAERISARSIVMPLIFFDGLRVCCYIGGVAGKEYLDQASYVAENMKLTYPPVVIWRPRDVYFGLGQLEALLQFRSLSGTFDMSKYSLIKASLRREISAARQQVEDLESRKGRLSDAMTNDKQARIEEIRALTKEQVEIRRRANLPVLMRNVVLLENVGSVMRLYPSIIDYVVNIGLKNVSEQWVAFLEKNGDLVSTVRLKTDLEVDLAMLPYDSLSEAK